MIPRDPTPEVLAEVELTSVKVVNGISIRFNALIQEASAMGQLCMINHSNTDMPAQMDGIGLTSSWIKPDLDTSLSHCACGLQVSASQYSTATSMAISITRLSWPAIICNKGDRLNLLSPLP